MITDIILLIIGSIIYLISSFFAAISWTIPSQMTDALEFFFAKIHNVDFLVPADTLMAALGVYLTFLLFWYSIKIILWVYHLIRHGQKSDPAKMHK